MLPNFFLFLDLYRKGKKKNKRKESEVLFNFQYLALLKLKGAVLHAAYTLPFRGFLMGGQLLEFRRDRKDSIKDY